ncbi:ABC transporter substrate-binding protein [Kocuria flava]|uniref:ABC transporter substrate-binding protein n=1 Tax=Kocuria flava TaxID=446860 RepID=A0A0U2YT47_9MICC|nr:ABC transporter substrate-binding protein [Kocuria flava]ALU38689.1 ABC transporter substrate-binding protein [Kocuria flava]GEO92059.1 basic amino acid ABC transporter substrate-binding protein [Kocuria flava]
MTRPAQRRTRGTLSLLAVSALALSACAGGGGEEEGGGEAGGGEVQLINEGTLTVCSDIPYRPFEYTEDGETVGFDVDLVNAIAEDMGVETEFIRTSFEGIQSGVALDSDQCDLAASGMTINEERESVMDFSEPYLDDNLALLVTPDSGIQGVGDVAGKRIGVQQATTGEAQAQENGAEVVQYEDSALMIQGLNTGDVEGVIGNISVMGPAITDNPDLRLVEEIETGEQLGLAVKTGNTALLEQVDRSLATMKEDGSLAELEAKWLGTGEAAGGSTGEPTGASTADPGATAEPTAG